MKDYLQRPSMMEEARQTSKGHNWFIELLIFIAVFLITNLIAGIIPAIGMLANMFTSPEFMAIIENGGTDTQQITEFTDKFTASMPDWITILVLFCELLIIGGTFIYCCKIERRKLATLGFRKKNLFKEYSKGLLIGLSMFVVAVLIGVLTGSLKITGVSAQFSMGLVVLFFVGYLIQGMAEEVICRGYLMVSISRRYSIPIAVIISSLVFAALHLLNSNITVFAVINLILFGIFAAIVMIKQGNIWIVGGIHSMWNFAQGNIFGIQVSGMGKQNSILNSTMVEGRYLISGGAFGLEGGIAVTIVLLAGIIFVVYRAKSSEKNKDENYDVSEA